MSKKLVMSALVGMMSVTGLLNAASKERVALSCWLDRSIRVEISADKQIQSNDWTVRLEKIHFFDGKIDEITLDSVRGIVEDDFISFDVNAKEGFISIRLEIENGDNVNGISGIADLQLQHDEQVIFNNSTEVRCEMLRY